MLKYFKRELVEALGLEKLEVEKITLNIGPKKRTAVATLILTQDQLAALDLMVSNRDVTESAPAVDA